MTTNNLPGVTIRFHDWIELCRINGVLHGMLSVLEHRLEVDEREKMKARLKHLYDNFQKIMENIQHDHQ